MKLFFETAAQASVFLLTVPLGLLLAFLVDLSGRTGTLRPLWDVLTMLAGFAAAGAAIVLLGDSGLRIYHILAMLTGMLLYLLGIRAFAGRLCKRVKAALAKNAQTAAGIRADESN